MKRLLLLAPLVVLLGCSEETPTEGAVKLTVAYSGFKPGCVRVTARDTGGAGESSAEVAGKGEVTGGTLTVAIFRDEGWSSELEVVAQAFERGCPAPAGGQPVVSASQIIKLVPGESTPLELALKAQDTDGDGFVATADNGSDCNDGSAQVFPGAEERCNQVDDNCNDETDEAFAVGTTCDLNDGCKGTVACTQAGGTECKRIPNLWRPDTDGDGKGDRTAPGVDACAQPAGHVANELDCDDGDATRYVNAPELCDNKDNDCDDVDDVVELNLGATCTPETGCGGQRGCALDGSVQCVATSFGTPYYPDDDYDSYGRVGAETVSSCETTAPRGYSTNNTDCDDGNPFTHPSARELCDVADNDCDGSNEKPDFCPPGGPGWIPLASLVISPLSWRSVSVWGDGGVWISGDNQRRALKQPGSTSFDPVLTSDCTGDWHSVWADPVTGRAYLGSHNGQVTFNDPGSATCGPTTNTPVATVNGMVGLRSAGVLEIHGVGLASSETARTFIWNGGAGMTPGTSPVSEVYDVHGPSRELLFAVGGLAGTARIFRFNALTGQWQSENIENSIPTAGTLDGIWVTHDKLAYAVGANGTVLRWNGAVWSRVPFPGTDNLTSVIAFGRNSVYATASNGRIFRYNGSTWEFNPSISGLTDIAGTSPEDLWVVGASGHVFHWPK